MQDGHGSQRHTVHLHSSSIVDMLRKTILSVLVVCAGTACAGTPHVGDPIELRGTLTLKGNEPFTYPVVADGTKLWELVGVDHATALKLQTHVVRVNGHVTTTGVPSGLPAIQVDSIRAGDTTTP